MKSSHTIVIEAPASLVFQILMDAELAAKWIPTLTSYRLISEIPNQVGSMYESLIQHKDMKLKQISEIKTYVENQHIEWSTTVSYYDINLDIYDGEIAYFLTPISDTQTEFKLVSECRHKGLFKFLVWLTKSKSKKKIEDSHDEIIRNLKSLVEMTYYG